MAQINKDNKIWVYYVLRNAGAQNMRINLDDTSSNTYKDINTNGATDYYRFDDKLYSISTTTIWAGDNTRAGQVDKLQDILGVVGQKRGLKYYYAWGAGPSTGEGENFVNLWATINSMGSNDVMNLVIEYISNEADSASGNDAVAPSWDDPILYYWDGSNLYIRINGSDYLIGAAANQAAVETLLESIYVNGDWNFAIDTNTGEIIVTYEGTGSGTWTYSVELEETITFNDEISAWVQLNRQEFKKKWVVR